MKIALAGASGLTGGHVLNLLLQNSQVTKVVSIGRKKLRIQHQKIEEVMLSENLPNIKVDAFICCLGTTIKKAGSREAFEKVDVELPIQLALALKRAGCDTAAVVSAIGADASSSIFYNRAKGKMENGMKEIGLKSLSILRPSIIAGERKEKRLAEQAGLKIMKAIAPLMVGPMRKYRPIHAATIANALVKSVVEKKPGVRILESDEIETLAVS